MESIYESIELTSKQKEVVLDVLKSRYYSILKSKNPSKGADLYWVLTSCFGIKL